MLGWWLNIPVGMEQVWSKREGRVGYDVAVRMGASFRTGDALYASGTGPGGSGVRPRVLGRSEWVLVGCGACVHGRRALVGLGTHWASTMRCTGSGAGLGSHMACTSR